MNQKDNEQRSAQSALVDAQTRKYSLNPIFRLNASDYKEFMCGWGSALINITVTYPINKVIFRQVRRNFPNFNNNFNNLLTVLNCKKLHSNKLVIQYVYKLIFVATK